MKKTLFILALSLVFMLASCEKTSMNGIQATQKDASEINTGALTLNAEQMNALTGSVIIDLNHPLAGKTLTFEVEIMKITKAAGNSQKDVVEKNDSLEVHYVGTLEDGSQFDSSRERGQTLPFTVGAGQMIPGFDAGVVGMKLGELKTLTIAPKDAYGEKDPTRTQKVPKKDLASFVAAGFKLEKGEKLPTQYGELEIIDVVE